MLCVWVRKSVRQTWVLYERSNAIPDWSIKERSLRKISTNYGRRTRRLMTHVTPFDPEICLHSPFYCGRCFATKSSYANRADLWRTWTIPGIARDCPQAIPPQRALSRLIPFITDVGVHPARFTHDAAPGGFSRINGVLRGTVVCSGHIGSKLSPLILWSLR